METDLQEVIARAARRLKLPMEKERTPTTGVVVIADAQPERIAARFLSALKEGQTVALLPDDWDGERRKTVEAILQSYGKSGYGKENPEILILTGGSGGVVRFARHRWETLRTAAEYFGRRFGAEMTNTVITLPMYHVSGLMAFVRAMVWGGTVVWKDYRSLIEEEAILPVGGSVSLVPTQLERWLSIEKKGGRLKDLGGVFVGGAKMPEELREEARNCGLRLVPCYGMTETAAFVCALESDAFLKGIEGCGEAMGQAEILIRNGEVGIKSASLCYGYWPEVGTFDRRCFMTGDRGRINERGSLVIEGRKDRLINTGGEKVDPGRIERLFESILGEGQVVLLGIEDREWGERLVAVYEGMELSKERLNAIGVQVGLQKHEIPKEWIQMEAIPRNRLGKVLYGELKEKIESRLKRP